MTSPRGCRASQRDREARYTPGRTSAVSIPVKLSRTALRGVSAAHSGSRCAPHYRRPRKRSNAMAVGVVYQVWARNHAPGKSVIMQRKLFAAIGLAGLLIAGAAALSAAQGGQAPS